MVLQTVPPSVLQRISSLVRVLFIVQEISMERLEQRPRCLKCQGSLVQTMIDMRNRVSILQFVCLSCGRPWPAGVKLRPVIAG